MGNKNSAVSGAHGNTAKAAPPAPKVAAKVEAEPRHVPMLGKTPTKAEAQGTRRGGQHGLRVQHSEVQGNETLDVDDTFTEYIKRANNKIRTVSNAGGGQSNPVPHHEANDASANKKENQRDHFSDFIQVAKKKMRTTSSFGKTGSLKRG